MEVATELVKVIPSILWFVLVLALVLLFYRPIRDDLLPNLTALKAGGVELSFVKESIDEALKLAEKSPQWEVKVPSRDKEHAIRRARKHLNVFRDSKFHFRPLKAEIDTAKSTEETFEIFRNGGTGRRKSGSSL